MAAIMATLVTDNVAQMNVTAYSGFMVENLGVVDDKDKAGKIYSKYRISEWMHVCADLGGLLADVCWEN